MIAPMSTTPWIAFAPDISGVWRTDGTFEITSMPTITDRMSTHVHKLDVRSQKCKERFHYNRRSSDCRQRNYNAPHLEC